MPAFGEQGYDSNGNRSLAAEQTRIRLFVQRERLPEVPSRGKLPKEDTAAAAGILAGKHKPRGFKRAMRMRKTIERVFGEAKVWHRMARARYRRLERVKIQVLMTFMVMNVKKMARATA